MSIPLAFLIISSLILWFIIGAKGQWFLKLITMTFTFYLCLSIGISLQNWAGWPSDQPLPEEFIVHWIKVKEPHKKTGASGHIYVWASSVGEYYQKDGWDGWRKFLISFYTHDPKEPRVHRLPYSVESHERAQTALGSLMRGKGVGGKNKGGKGDGGEGEGGNGDTNGDGNGGGSLSRSDDIIFHELPPSRLPEK